jgi:hypothetical protein
MPASRPVHTPILQKVFSVKIVMSRPTSCAVSHRIVVHLSGQSWHRGLSSVKRSQQLHAPAQMACVHVFQSLNIVMGQHHLSNDWKMVTVLPSPRQSFL